MVQSESAYFIFLYQDRHFNAKSAYFCYVVHRRRLPDAKIMAYIFQYGYSVTETSRIITVYTEPDKQLGVKILYVSCGY